MRKKITFTLIIISTILFTITTFNNAYSEEITNVSDLSYSFQNKKYYSPAIDYNSQQAQTIYNAIYDCLKTYGSHAEFPRADREFVSNIFYKFLDDHSEYHNCLSFSTPRPDNENKISYVGFSYDYSKEDFDKLDKTLNAIIASIITPDMTDLQKELAVHDYLCLNCTYDHSKKTPVVSHTPYGAIMNHTAVCDGYLGAMNCLLDKAGIKSISMTAYSMNHGWNIVTINGKTYNTDVTWDDPDDGTKINYAYFNQDDTTFLRTHHWDSTEPHTPCTSTDYSSFQNAHAYFRINNDIYFSTSGNQYIYKSDMRNGLNLNSSLFIRDNIAYPTYYNGWIYCSKSSNLSNLYRININNPSKEETMKTNINPSAIYVSQGTVHFYNGNIQLKAQVKIPNYNRFDFNGDNKVDTADLAELALHYNKCASSLYSQSNEDLNRDDIIDIYDIVRLSVNIN